MKQLQEAVKKSKSPAKWATQRPTKFKLPNTKPIMGKPPLDPKATFARFKGPAGSRGITVLAGRSTMTPPSTFASDVRIYISCFHTQPFCVFLWLESQSLSFISSELECSKK